jgi:hypothetical protein
VPSHAPSISVLGTRVNESCPFLSRAAKCHSHLQAVASHTCNRPVLPCFEAFELSRGATSVVVRYTTAVECAGDPYRYGVGVLDVWRA